MDVRATLTPVENEKIKRVMGDQSITGD